jgi:hypothetical protein
MAKFVFYPVLISLLLFSSSLFAEGIVISRTSGSGSFPLVANNTSAMLVVEGAYADVVKIAAQA